MSDRSWRDFFESRSFYEYEIFSQKLPLRYAVRRNYTVDALSFVSRSDDDLRRRRRRRRCGGFYWCCCCKTIALLVVALVVASLIGGLSYYFSKNRPSTMDNQPYNATNATTPDSSWMTTSSWNLFTNKTILPWTTHETITTSMVPPSSSTKSEDKIFHDEFVPSTPETSDFTIPSTEVPFSSDDPEVTSDSTTTGISERPSTIEAHESTEDIVVTAVSPVDQQTSPSPTQTTEETFALTPTQNPVNMTSSVPTTESALGNHTKDEWTTESSVGNTYVSTDQKTSSTRYPLGLPNEGIDLSTILDEQTTLETNEETTTLQPWMSISSTSITDDFTEDEISTPKPWMNVSSSTLSDGFTDDYGSGMSENV